MHEKEQTITTTFIIDGCVVKINRPILTEEERKRREQIVVSALNNFKRS